MGSLPRLQMSFTEKGIEKLAELTQSHLNERIAIFTDGKLTELPVVKEKILHGTSLTLAGRLTESEIKRIIGEEVK